MSVTGVCVCVCVSVCMCRRVDSNLEQRITSFFHGWKSRFSIGNVWGIDLETDYLPSVGVQVWRRNLPYFHCEVWLGHVHGR